MILYAQYSEKNKNDYYVAVYEGDGTNMSLVDPDAANDSERIGEAVYIECPECGLPREIRREGTIGVTPLDVCVCVIK
jgi:hypothetical protein